MIPPHYALLAGAIISQVAPINASYRLRFKTWAARLLQVSIVLLGSSLNFYTILKDGPQGLIITLIWLLLVLFLGEILARLFKVSSPLSLLISVGSAICGGSAIGAVSPVLRADPVTMATALSIVFILNAVAVFLFPGLGHLLGLSQSQFGTWAALAIHDTSSVVAASQIYGEEALKVGTTLKLTRALWIIPVTLVLSFLKKSSGRLSVPWFILLFLVNSLIFTFVTEMHGLIPLFKETSRTGFSMTLFLIGLTINREQLKNIEWGAMKLSLVLWLIIVTLSLGYVMMMR